MENELYHYGRKGMKWYQNIFSKGKGSGAKKRVADDDEVLTEPKQKTAYQKARTSVSDMSDDDLRSAIQRLQNERTYQQLYNELNPPKISKGKQFLDTVMTKTITPALTDAGKRVLTDFAVDQASKALGLRKKEMEDSFAALKKEVEGLELNKRKTQVEDFYKAREEKAAKKAEKQANKESNKSEKASEDKGDSTNSRQAEKASNAGQKSARESQSEKASGTVEGAGTSKFTGWKSDKASSIIDGEWRDVTPSKAKSSPEAAVGQQFVAGLLGQKTYQLEDKHK